MLPDVPRYSQMLPDVPRCSQMLQMLPDVHFSPGVLQPPLVLFLTARHSKSKLCLGNIYEIYGYLHRQKQQCNGTAGTQAEESKGKAAKSHQHQGKAGPRRHRQKREENKRKDKRDTTGRGAKASPADRTRREEGRWGTSTTGIGHWQSTSALRALV